MIVRAMLLRLLVMAVMAMIGAWTRRRVPTARKGRAVQSARKCPECGAYVLGEARCPCREG